MKETSTPRTSGELHLGATASPNLIAYPCTIQTKNAKLKNALFYFQVHV